MNSLLNRHVDQTEFSNGYTASVVRFSDREFEVAVLVNGKPVYDTPVTCDVVRCETRQEAETIVDQILELPPRNGITKHLGPIGTA